jgi:Chs5-Arf1p-binding protein BUD7/BCH1
MIRSILYADDESYRITGYRRVNPVPNKDAERRFLDAAERLFSQGWQLGSDAEVQVANASTNHLSSALMKYFSITGRWEQGIALFQRLKEREPEVNLLLAQLFLEMGLLRLTLILTQDEEVKAVDLMCASLVDNPINHGFLVLQSKYLLEKNRPDLALELAKAAVNANPSEYATWSILAESYVANDDFENVPLAEISLM